MSTITLQKGKKAMSTKEFQQGKHKEPAMNENNGKEMLPAETNVRENHMQLLPISKNTYINAIKMAGLSRKHALHLELACALSVYAQYGGITRAAKRFLVGLYAESGYDCLDPQKSSEYKTIMRRAGIAAATYLYLGHEKVSEMIGGAAEGMALDSLVKGLEPLNIRSLDNLMATIGKPRLPAAKATPAQIEGEKQADKKQEGEPEGNVPKANAEQQLEPGEIVLPEEPKGKAEEHVEKELPDDMQGPRWMRRVGDIEGATHLDSPSVHIIIAPNASKDELTKIAKQLMALAEAMNGQHKESHVKEKEHEPEGVLQAELRNVPEPMKRRGRRVITR